MKYDFHAQYALEQQGGITRAEAIDFLTGVQAHPPRQWQILADVTDDGARLQLLAQALVSAYKERARMGQLKDKAGGLGHWVMSGKAHTYLATQKETYLAPLGLAPVVPDLARLPRYSFVFHFTFTLASAYLSRDDTDFYILDNPVKKEWVFKLPYIAPSQWKGALRAAMVQQLTVWWQSLDQKQQYEQVNRKRFVAQRVQLTRLFGTEIEHDQHYLSQSGGDKLARWYQRYVRRFLSRTGFIAGCLHFYPTFFDRIGLEVINPHDRETGAGKQPIYFESVPADATGTFTLLYVPFDRIGEDETETRKQVAADLRLVAAGIQAMMTTYGFGAKTSSGFGVAIAHVEGQLALNHIDPRESEARRGMLSEPTVPVSVRAFYEVYPDETFSDKPNAWREKHKATTNERERYKQARSDYQAYQRQLQAYEQDLSERENVDTQSSSHAAKPLTFISFADLEARAKELAQRLQGLSGSTT